MQPLLDIHGSELVGPTREAARLQLLTVAATLQRLGGVAGRIVERAQHAAELCFELGREALHTPPGSEGLTVSSAGALMTAARAFLQTAGTASVSVEQVAFALDRLAEELGPCALAAMPTPAATFDAGDAGDAPHAAEPVAA
jgi:hypothetical protein